MEEISIIVYKNTDKYPAIISLLEQERGRAKILKGFGFLC